MQFFSPNGPSFLYHHDSPSNMEESRYPRAESRNLVVSDLALANRCANRRPSSELRRALGGRTQRDTQRAQAAPRQVFVPGIGQMCKRPALRARLGVHGLADNSCARALFGSMIRRLPAGAARRCSSPRPRPDRFSCLASAAGCCCLFIHSRERAWGSRRHSGPQRFRLDPQCGYLALTVACF